MRKFEKVAVMLFVHDGILFYLEGVYLMNWFRNWKIRTKILALVVLMSLLTGTVGFVGYFYNAKANAQITSMYSNSLLSIEYLNDARAEASESEAFLFKYLLTQDKSAQLQLQNELEATVVNFKESYNSYMKLPADPYEKEKGSILEKESAMYTAERQKAMDIAKQGDSKGAYEYFNNNAYSHKDVIDATLRDLADYNAKNADEVNHQNNADYAAAKKMMMTLSVVAVLLGLILGLFIANLIASSIKKVLAGVERVATGDLTVEDITIKDQDEAGQLASSFNQMKNQLYEVVKHVTQSSEQVAASSEELNAITEETAQASNQIASAISEVTQGTERQAHAVDETSAAMEQMSASIQQLAATTITVTEHAEVTQSSTEEGRKAVENAVKQMDAVAHSTAEVHEAINKLSSSSSQIGEITNVISGIAAQTNLLALNAAIEAARAGEQGRGFAVVAEEVRKLAEQSAEAATKIASLIGENQMNIRDAVHSMDSGAHDVQLGIEVVNKAGEAFSEIARSVSELSAQAQEMAATTQEMAGGSEQIVSSAQEIDNISKQNLDYTQTVSAAVEEQSASVEQIASSSQMLTGLAEQLQLAVSKFRL